MGNLAQLSDIFKQSLTSNIEIKTTFIGAEYFSNEINFKIFLFRLPRGVGRTWCGSQWSRSQCQSLLYRVV